MKTLNEVVFLMVRLHLHVNNLRLLTFIQGEASRHLYITVFLILPAWIYCFESTTLQVYKKKNEINAFLKVTCCCTSYSINTLSDFTYSHFLKNIVLKWLKIVYSFSGCSVITDYLLKLSLLMDLVVTKVITVILAFTHARHKTNQVNNML